MEITRMVRNIMDEYELIHEKLDISHRSPVVGENIVVRAKSLVLSEYQNDSLLCFHRDVNNTTCWRITFHKDTDKRDFEKYFTWVAEMMSHRAWWGEMIFLINRDEDIQNVVIETPIITSFAVKYVFPLDVDFRIHITK